MTLVMKAKRLPSNLSNEQVRRIGINNYAVRMYEYNLMYDDMVAVYSKLNEVDAEGYKGVIDCSTNPNYPASSINWYYRVSVAGKIGGAGGIDVEIGDVITCIATSAAGDHATVGANFMITQKNMVYLTAANMIASPSGTSDYVTAKTLTDLGLTFNTTNRLAIAGGTVTQILATTTAGAKGLQISGSAKTKSDIEITTTIADETLGVISSVITRSTAFTTAKQLVGFNQTITGIAADVDDSHYMGCNVILNGVTTSLSDYTGYRINHAGTYDSGVGTQNVVGLQITPTCTLNGANVDMYGINMDFTGMTNTASNDVFGIRIVSSGSLIDRAFHATNAVNAVSLVSTTYAISMTGNMSIAAAGVTSGHLFDFTSTGFTTGSIFNIGAITTKTSGYLYNGSMTTSTLDATTILDDFSVSCAHDGLAADTLRGIRRIWSGAMPNGTAAPDFNLIDLQWNSSFGSGAAIGGTPVILNVSSSATINDTAANFYGVNLDYSAMTLTNVANCYGARIVSIAGFDAGINITGAATSGISISGAATQQLLLTSTIAEKALTINSTNQTVTPVTITSTSAVISAAYITAMTSNLTVTGASAVNMIEAGQFVLNSDVQMGNWANALCAKIDMSTNGYVTGLAGVVCAELQLPSAGVLGGAGTYTCFEAELGMDGVSNGAPVSAMAINVWGAQTADFDSNGYIIDLAGVTVGAGKVFQANTAADATHALRIRIGGVPYYIMLTNVGA